MKIRLLYVILFGAFCIDGFEVKTMEKSSAEHERVIIAPHITLQEREKKADFVVKKSFLLSEKGCVVHKTVTLDKEGSIQIWDTISGELLKTLESNYSEKGVRDVCFEGKNGNILAIYTTAFLIRAAAL